MKSIISKGLFLLMMASLVLAACSGEKTKDVVFQGTVTGPWEGHVVMLYNNLTNEKDSAEIIDGQFVIVRPFTEATRHMFFSTYDTRVKKGYAPFGLLVDEPGLINIELEIADGFAKAEVSGSKSQELLSNLLEKQNSLNQQGDEQASEEAMSGEMTRVISNHPDLLVSPFLLDRMGNLLDLELREDLFNELSSEMKQTYFGIRSHNLIQGLKRSAIGNRVEDFLLANEKGDSINFDAFLGQYVLLDFWASWCGPCISEIPKFKDIYSKYHDRGFEMVGISIDKNHEAWLRALENHQMGWPQLIDNEADNIANSYFAVTAVPTTFLLDPEGKILIRNIKGEELDKKLSELLLE